jgi:Ca2+-binding EF-hand superfamily protein
MKIVLAALAVAGLAFSSTAVLAQDMGAVNPSQTFTGVDTDRNGTVSWAEFSLIFTDYTEEQFNAADLDGDGQLSAEEFDGLVLATGSIATDPANLPGTGKSLTDTTTE